MFRELTRGDERADRGAGWEDESEDEEEQQPKSEVEKEVEKIDEDWSKS